LDGFLGTAGLSQLSDASGIGQVLFASACGLSLYSASPALVEKANNTFVFILAGCLIGIIGVGAGSADFSSLVDLSNQHPEQVPNAFPIIFLSLGFQNVVPTVVKRLEGDRGKITKAIITGTSIPTLMFVAWNAVVLGNTKGADLANMDPVALLQSAEGGNSVLGNLIRTFSTLALVTSLISFVYGLLDAWADVFSLPREGPDFEKWKTPLFVSSLCLHWRCLWQTQIYSTRRWILVVHSVSVLFSWFSHRLWCGPKGMATNSSH